MYSEYIIAQGIDDKYSISAAEHIDILTFNRITDFDKLTDFQQRIIKRVHKQLEVFERENEDILNSQLASYSLNGVSMSFGGQSVKFICGVAIPADTFALLLSTGLSYPAI